LINRLSEQLTQQGTRHKCSYRKKSLFYIG
jgi:hypothetical protein